MPLAMDGALDSAISPPLLPRLLAPLRQRWWLMPAGAALLLALVLVYLLRAQPVWTAQMRVYAAPASEGLAPRRGGLAGLAGGLAGLGGALGNSEAAPPFRYFLDGLATPDVAARLAADESILQAIYVTEWDAANKRWRAPSRGVVGGARALAFGVLGLPVAEWSKPDAARLRLYIEDRVEVRSSVRSPLVMIAHAHPDPVFAARFLEALAAAADAELRRDQAARTAANIDYLSRQLRGTVEAEARLALVDALAAEERGAMLSAVPMPYAAEIFSKPETGRWPSSPRPLPLLLAGLFVGLLLGAAAALWLGWRAGPGQPDGG
jgi:hypothetical protein